MSIKRDVNGYKVFDLPDGGQLLWSEEDRVLFSRPADYCTPLTMDSDDEFDELLKAAEFAIYERNQAIQELRDYKAKRGENIGEMLDARAEADQLLKELEEARNVIGWYADASNYVNTKLWPSDPACTAESEVSEDEGKRARAYLGQEGEKA
ncbi:hypothetical protein [Paenibacillus sp. 276b]|uniref:hypothetical protein n=1 Tax=Paenibacillus sp. 276b TaxID=1566277 RepID=UPI0008947F4B|nr:hypothetical protein [Paenibacillus sp. 276b]SEB28041.1 hypothetical protein SAMN03159332_0126 [Paenibacillus sp. 276b]